MRRFILTMVVCALAVGAAAQQPSSLGDDAAAAVQSAQARFDAADATGNLPEISAAAAQLSRILLQQNRRQEALAPARRVQQLAEQGVGDPLLARLLVGRAEILTNWRARDRLHEAVQEAADRMDLYPDLYLAASELGRAQLQGDRLREALQSWTVAERSSSAAPADPENARARALVMQAIALIYYFPDRNRFTATDLEVLAHNKLHQATRMIIARNDPPAVPEQDMTPAARTYAMALAWHSLLTARLSSVRDDLPPWRDENRLETGLAGPRPDGQCSYDLVFGEEVTFPRSAIHDTQVAAVVVRFHIAENGEVVRREIAASAPERPEFIAAVTSVMGTWTARRTTDPASDCSAEAVLTVPVIFGYE